MNVQTLLLTLIGLAGVGGGAWWLGLGNALMALIERRRKAADEARASSAEQVRLELERSREARAQQEQMVRDMAIVISQWKDRADDQERSNLKLEERLERETQALRERIRLLEHDRDTLQGRIDDLEAENAHLKTKIYDLQHPRPRPLNPPA